MTATKGLSQSCATVLATMAVETKGAPIPGPAMKESTTKYDKDTTAYNIHSLICARSDPLQTFCKTNTIDFFRFKFRFFQRSKYFKYPTSQQVDSHYGNNVICWAANERNSRRKFFNSWAVENSNPSNDTKRILF